MDLITEIALECWNILLSAGIYIFFGIAVAGMLKIFLSPSAVASHLGKGRFLPVLKASLFGIPLPL